jgi:hypothetical protein
MDWDVARFAAFLELAEDISEDTTVSISRGVDEAHGVGLSGQTAKMSSWRRGWPCIRVFSLGL